MQGANRPFWPLVSKYTISVYSRILPILMSNGLFTIFRMDSELFTRYYFYNLTLKQAREHLRGSHKTARCSDSANGRQVCIGSAHSSCCRDSALMWKGLMFVNLLVAYTHLSSSVSTAGTIRTLRVCTVTLHANARHMAFNDFSWWLIIRNIHLCQRDTALSLYPCSVCCPCFSP